MKKELVWVLLAFALGLFLSVEAWPQTVAGVYIGIDADKVGKGNTLGPDGENDNHVRISNVKNVAIAKVTITDDSNGTWVSPFNNVNWNIHIERVTTTVDLWFAQYRPFKFVNVTLSYVDGTTDRVSVPNNTVPSGLAGKVTIAQGQTLCATLFINADASITAVYWSGLPPCATSTNVSLLKITYVSGLTMCAEKILSAFDLWTSKTLPCVHP